MFRSSETNNFCLLDINGIWRSVKHYVLQLRRKYWGLSHASSQNTDSCANRNVFCLIFQTRQKYDGSQPTLESRTLLVASYARAGDPETVRGHFDHMIRCGHRPDDQCTSSMISAYLMNNLLDKALDLLLTLEKDGFQPGIATYTVLVDWMGRLQLVDEAERLLNAIREKGEAPFEVHVSLCDMYARALQEEKARKYLKILEGRKELLRADQFERIVSGLVAGGFVKH